MDEKSSLFVCASNSTTPEMIPHTSPCFCVPDTFGYEADIIMTSFPNHLQSEVSKTLMLVAADITHITHVAPTDPRLLCFLALLFPLCHFSSEPNCCLLSEFPSRA